MFSFLARDGALALRCRKILQHGAAFSEYAELASYFAASYAYAKTLKANPTKKAATKRKS